MTYKPSRSTGRGRRLSLRWTVAAVLPVAAGCTVGPDYHPPPTPMPAQFAEASGAQAEPTAIAVWWKSVGDPELDALVARALAANPDMDIAASRVREARLGEILAGAPYWPTVAANAAAERTRVSSNEVGHGIGVNAASPGGVPVALGLPGTTFNTFQLGFDATWQLDFFGRTRRSVEAAKADTMAQEWGMRDTEVSLAAEVAGTYLALRFTDERTRIALSDLARLQQTLHLLEVRAGGGMSSQLDVRQQEAEVAKTAAGIPRLEAQARAQAHALAVLLGESPEEFRLDPPAGAIPPVPQAVPVGLPSELLRRRPDIRQAERTLAAATATIGVAVADLYPQFSLTGSPSLVSRNLHNLASSGSFGYALGASVLWPVFNGGQTRANIAIANENQQQVLAAYRKTVLTALKEVDDALSTFAHDQERVVRLEQSAASAASAEQLAQEQYAGGLVDFSRVLSAEGTRLTADDELIQGKAAISLDWVALYKALGGGWREEDLADTSKTKRESG